MIHVTDLASVWTETLDKKGILRRSLTEDTSIDLIDAGPDQWGVFLSKLSAAFDDTSADHALTGLSVESAATAAAAGSFSSAGGSGGRSLGEDDLVLRITCVLPEPLAPLKWPVCLGKCTPAAAAGKLLVPLLVAQRGLRADVDDLVARLAEKDAVITRLVDKLEAMGAGLENVFHALPGKRRTTRAVAEDKVKGLRVFREKDWMVERREEERRRNHDGGGDAGGGRGSEGGDGVAVLAKDCFREGVQSSRQGDQRFALSDGLNGWWSKLGSEPVVATKPIVDAESLSSGDDDSEHKGGLKKQKKHKSITNTASATLDDDDDFQVQSTPPYLQQQQSVQNKKPSAQGGRTARSAAIDSDETDSGDEDISIPDSHPQPANRAASQDVAAHAADRPSQATPVHDDVTASESDAPMTKAPRSVPARRSKLGGIGARKGKHDESERAEAKPQIAEKPRAADDGPAGKNNGDDENTASDSDSDVSMIETKGKSESPAPPPATRQPRKGGLGKISARDRVSPPPPSRRAQSPPSAQLSDDDSVLEVQALATSSRSDAKKSAATPAIKIDDDDSDNTAPSRGDGSPSPARSPRISRPPTSAPTATNPTAETKAPRRTIGTIGKIGGRKQNPAPATASATSAAEHNDNDDDNESKKRRRPDPGASTPTNTDTPAGLGNMTPGGRAGTAQEEEDDEQRAERKRAELAKELEKKAAAPAKKKRRF